MGKKKNKPADKNEALENPAPPKLVRRRENRNSNFKLGRTIGAKREKLETANERAAARKKDKHKKSFRVILTTLGFIVFIAAVLVSLLNNLLANLTDPQSPTAPQTTNYAPTIEIVDEASASGGKITTRMINYIGRAEKDFRDLGYTPVKAVFPSTAIREVDFYLDGYPGFIKLTIDRDSAVSVEDASRMLRYLVDKGITEFTYIDVRIDGKAYWK